MPTTAKAPATPKKAGRARAKHKRKTLGQQLIQGMQEIVEFERGQTHGERIHHYFASGQFIIAYAAPAFSKGRIAALRRRLKQSQPIFALMLNVSTETVRAWEQGRRQPEGSALRLLQVAHESPEVLLRNVGAKTPR